MATWGLLHSSLPCHESSGTIHPHAGLQSVRRLDGKNVSQHGNMPGVMLRKRRHRRS